MMFLAIGLVARVNPTLFKPLNKNNESVEQKEAEETLNTDSDRQLLCSSSQAESVRSFLDSTIAQVGIK